MLTHAPRCGVCGWRGADGVCPRCGTVLLRGRAFCPKCGKLFEGPLARCDACGGAVETPRPPAPSEVIARLVLLPGVDEDTARQLHARGFADPADVLKLALPERAVRLGLHRTLARRIALAGLKPLPHVRKSIACPVCGAPRTPSQEACPACGSHGGREPSSEEVARRFEEVAGVVHDLASDPDFREMRPEVQEEILDAFEDAGFVTSTESEYAEQFGEWRARGFDTQELEKILREEGPEVFKAKFVRVIRSQLLKRRQGDRFQCPLCDTELVSVAEECANCGAKFA